MHIVLSSCTVKLPDIMIPDSRAQMKISVSYNNVFYAAELDFFISAFTTENLFVDYPDVDIVYYANTLIEIST